MSTRSGRGPGRRIVPGSQDQKATAVNISSQAGLSYNSPRTDLEPMCRTRYSATNATQRPKPLGCSWFESALTMRQPLAQRGCVVDRSGTALRRSWSRWQLLDSSLALRRRPLRWLDRWMRRIRRPDPVSYRKAYHREQRIPSRMCAEHRVSGVLQIEVLYSQVHSEPSWTRSCLRLYQTCLLLRVDWKEAGRSCPGTRGPNL